MRSILPCSVESFAARLKKKQLMTVAVLAAVLVLNFAVCLLYRADHSLNIMWINVLTDTLALWCLFAWWNLQILPERRYLALAKRAQRFGIRIRGTVCEVSGKTEHHGFLCCHTATVQTDTVRKVFLPEMIALKPGDEAELLLCDNIVVEVAP